MGVGWSPLAARLVGRRHLEMERIRVGTSPAPARSSPTGRDLDHLRRHCAGDRPWVADRGRSHGNGDEPVSGKRELQRVRGVGLPSRALRRLDTWSRSNCRGVAGAHAARSMARQKEPARDGARGPGLRDRRVVPHSPSSFGARDSRRQLMPPGVADCPLRAIGLSSTAEVQPAIQDRVGTHYDLGGRP
jgi:hypothetical protein